MNVLLDGSPLYSNRSGVYRYTAKLYEHLSALGVHVKFLQNPVFFASGRPFPTGRRTPCWTGTIRIRRSAGS